MTQTMLDEQDATVLEWAVNRTSLWKRQPADAYYETSYSLLGYRIAKCKTHWHLYAPNIREGQQYLASAHQTLGEARQAAAANARELVSN